MTASVVLAPTTAAFGFCGHCHAELDPGHRCIPAIVEAPDLAPHRPCTECNELVGRHYGSRPVRCAGQPFGSAECANAWREAPRPTFSVPATFTVPVLRDEHGGQWVLGDAPDTVGGEFAAGSARYGRRRRAGAR
jgi:hypothetical protein